MEEPQRVFKIQYKVWWIIFFCTQIIILAMMIGSFSAISWVSSDNRAKIRNPGWNDQDNNIYDGGSFVGKLYSCKESCDETYSVLREKWCDFYDDIKDGDYDKNSINLYQSVCLMYQNLNLGMGFFSFFESFAMFSLICWCLGLVWFIYSRRHIWFAHYCSICTCLCHYSAFFAYTLIIGISFQGDCYRFPDDGRMPALCAESGPGIMLFLAMIIPVFVLFFGFLSYQIHYAPRIQPYDSFPEGHNSPVDIMPTNEIKENREFYYNSPGPLN